MKIGYPCLNYSIGCQANRSFKLLTASEAKFNATVENNLNCLQNILKWNLEHGILFFRISSETIPFASYEMADYEWQGKFSEKLLETGDFIKKNKMRISMHPGQFVVLNSTSQRVIDNSIRELEYHEDLLNAMKLGSGTKIQIQLGGTYGEKENTMDTFIMHFNSLHKTLKEKLAIENDEKNYTIKDCVEINKKTKAPIVFDSLHHEILNNREKQKTAMEFAFKTWRKKDSVPIVDYSSQEPNAIIGKHCQILNEEHFQKFLKKTPRKNFDLMLEIKDKEKSALKAINITNRKIF